jgi:3-oxoacyl-[acyl-carrier protein] reductase
MSEKPQCPPPHGLLAEKTVLVTAAAGTGIGFATAKRCAAEGATVMLSDAHERRLGETADVLAKLTGRRPPAVRCDVTVEADVQALITAAVSELGRIDVLINNAGLGGTAYVVDMSDEQWQRVLDVTLTGTFRMTRAALKHMIGRRQGRRTTPPPKRASWRSRAAPPSRPHQPACASTLSPRAWRCTHSSPR